MMYKTWKLNSEQFVTYNSRRYVRFEQKKNGCSYIIRLSFCQMDILNDIVHLITVKEKTNLNIPLGNGIVFMMNYTDRPCIHYFDRYSHRYFAFSERSWRKYITYVHRRLISVIKYERRTRDCQCSLANESNRGDRHTAAISHIKARVQKEPTEEEEEEGEEEEKTAKAHRVLSRASTHDAMGTEWNNRTLFQRWCNTNDRKVSNKDSGFEDERVSVMDIEDENEYAISNA